MNLNMLGSSDWWKDMSDIFFIEGRLRSGSK